MSLAGWILDDAPEGSSKPYTFAEDIVIESQSYLLLCDGDDCDMNLSISLNNEGEEISLTAPNGEVISSVTYPELGRGEAYAANPRQEESWCTSLIATPGKENVCRGIVVAKVSAEASVGSRGRSRTTPTTYTCFC